MIQIPRGIPLPIERAFQDVNSEFRKIEGKIESIDTGASSSELEALKREVARLTRKVNDESWRDLWHFDLGGIGFGKDLLPGYQLNMYTPIPVRVTGWTLVADNAGDLELDLEFTDYASFGVLSPVSMCGSEPPVLVSAQKNQNLSINTWTQNIPANAIVSVRVASVSGIMQASLVLNIRRM